MRSLTLLTLFALLLAGCGGPEPRRPVEVKTGSFFKESVERNKELLAQEEKHIQSIIAKDSLHEYKNSASGSWYYYEVENDQDVPTPRPDDLVTMQFEIYSFENDTIYSAPEIGTVTYKVDKQELFPGLRNSVKLLKEGETAVFFFPSSLGFGYHGDNNKIGVNVPLKVKLSILKIEQEPQELSINK
ncbi:gliding motility-associated peptidyl-prolyl isomerase GldI [Cytophaga sp. FL35]|uniref:gliding motility-associated peptidyl-prolyl isomerase GldI n=1 Tax=Cytophaga sp. FL35 TaxID=1904456 RepID=UPI001653D39C|nr:gliding motility-associated peptidyl-prolyl isomerase GldI [Cytophaga sp. FL35]MBC6997920.1 gliding motility-associated peptidyl-prolyl isomerase GldI [Cytophaga sp. FL35]